MSAYSLFRLENGSSPSSSSGHARQEPQNAPAPIELDEMPIDPRAVYGGPLPKPAGVRTQPSTYREVERAGPAAVEPDVATQSPGELEFSRPPSPRDSLLPATDIVQTWRNPSMNKWRLLSACLFNFANGCNDSAPGALLPYIERYYNIGYAIVSLIFIANAVGFILAAFFLHTIEKKLGRAKTLMLCDFVLIVGYIIIVTTPPFPAFVIAFFAIGWGFGTALAFYNIFCASLANSHVMLGLLHGSYGIGGTIGPIIATTLVTHGVIWSRYYLFVLGLRVVSFYLCGWSHWNFEEESVEQTLRRAEDANTDLQLQRVESAKQQQLMKALKNKVTLAGALLIFAYQGAEVSTSGWVTSFLISYRGGDPSKVGYVTSGFWGGITVGRLFLSPIGSRIGDKLFVYCLIGGSLALQLLVWLVPNVVGESVAIALLGLLLGPVYPSATVVFTRLLPKSIQSTALGFIGGAGSSGGALAPFLTGILAQASGTWVLHPICISLFAVMTGMWFCLPRVQKRRD